MLDWLRQIVPDAKSFETVANVLILGFATLLGALAAKKQKNKPKMQDGETVEIAGAVIDSTMATALIAAIETNTKALHERLGVQTDLINHLTALRDEVRSVRYEAKEINDRLERIKDEIIRRRP